MRVQNSLQATTIIIKYIPVFSQKLVIHMEYVLWLEKNVHVSKSFRKKKNSACFPINSVSKTFGLAPHQYDWIINPLAIINTLL